MMITDKKVGNVPKLRFEGFEREWKNDEFGDLVSKSKEKYNPIQESQKYPCIELECLSQGTGILLNTFDSTEQLSLKNKFYKGEVLFGKLRPYLKKYLKAPFDGVCSSEIWVFKGSLTSNDFLYYLVQLKKFNDIANVSSGSKMPRADWSYLSSIPFKYPTLPEQQKIANFLSSIDKKIELLTQKVSLLEDYKKGVMQQIFSQQLRFKDDNGADFADWDWVGGNKLFKAISDRNHNSDLPILAITQNQGAIPRDMIDYQMSVTDKSIASYKVVQVGDFVISLRTFQGGIEYSNYKGICSPAYIILRPSSENIDRTFYRFYLKTSYYIKLLQKNLEGIRDGKMISYKYFSEIELPYPSLPEQQKIANFLSSIDDKIQQGQQQLEQVQAYKRGLLQQLFV